MKRLFQLCIIAVMTLLATGTIAQAESNQYKKAFLNEHLKTNPFYENLSVQILEEKELENGVTGMLVEYNIEKSDIFYEKKHQEIFYYDQQKDEIVTSDELKQTKTTKAFEKEYKESLGVHTNYAPIMLLMSLFLFIPAFIMYVYLPMKNAYTH